MENERIALSIGTIPENVRGVRNLAKVLNDTILQPNESFSLLDQLGDEADSADIESLNLIGSMLYKTVLQARIDILERSSQNTLPSYLQPGMDAYVNPYENKDLVFSNISEYPYLLKMTVEGTSLKVELFSSVKEADIKVNVKKESIAPRIINRYSNDLPIGKTKLIQEGEPGLRVTVTRMITLDGNIEEQQISRDYYPPTNRIVLNSSREMIEEEGTDTIQGVENKNDSSKLENADLNGDGLPDYDARNEVDEVSNDSASSGSYYDKGGNLITPSKGE